MRLPFVVVIGCAVLAMGCGKSDKFGIGTSGGGGGKGSGGGSTLNIEMSAVTFVPAVDTVAVGQTVTWTNNDQVIHTVTADSGSVDAFDSGDVAGSGTYTHAFQTAGTYGYYCRYHGSMTGGMRGTIVVR